MDKQNGALETLCVSTLKLDDHMLRKKTVQTVRDASCEDFETRVRRLISDKNSVSQFLPSLDEYLKIRSKLSLCLQLLLDSSNIETDVKANLLDGKLLKAYQNFIRYEECRNGLLDLMGDDEDAIKFAEEQFGEVEWMAIQIRDVIRLNLNGIANGDTSFSEQIVEEIMQIIDSDSKTDAIAAMREQQGLKGYPCRPRNWRSYCMSILNQQLQRGMKGPLETLTKKIIESCLKDVDTSEPSLSHEITHNEEMMVMKKYFGETRLREMEFYKALDKFWKKENILEKARTFISNGDLMAAYEMLAKVESIRYHVLASVKKKDENSKLAKLISSTFEEAKNVYTDFEKEAQYYCARGIDIMRGKEPEPRKQLEVVLRAVEIDEMIDRCYEKLGVKLDDRPHYWRKLFFDVIEERVQQRIEAFQAEDRVLNKNWVTRNLEICRLYIVEDLYAAKQFLKIFSKEHQLYDRFVIFYHLSIANKITEIAKGDLNKRELIQLLSWIRNYPGEHMLGLAFLEINADALVTDKPLLPHDLQMDLYHQFVDITRQETANWAQKAIKQEFANIAEFSSSILEDGHGYYYTHLPNILYSIVNDQLILSGEVSPDVVPQVLNDCLFEYIRIIPLLSDSVTQVKNLHKTGNELSDDITRILIAVANNLDMCAESTDHLTRYLKNYIGSAEEATVLIKTKKVSSASSPSRTGTMKIKTYIPRQINKMQTAIHGAVSTIKDIPAALAYIVPASSLGVIAEAEVNDVITLEDEDPVQESWERLAMLKEQFNELLSHVMMTLCEEVYNDLGNFFDQLLDKQWYKGLDIAGTICATVQDYEQDYKHLRSTVHLEILRCIQIRLIAAYLSAIDSRKIACTEHQKRCIIAKRLRSDADAIEKTFRELFSELDEENTTEQDELHGVLRDVAEFIELRDKSMLPLEAASFVRKYPDISYDLFFSLIDARDDMTSTESRSLVEETLRAVDTRSTQSGHNAVFVHLFAMAKGERKTSHLIKAVMPRLRRRVRVNIAAQ